MTKNRPPHHGDRDSRLRKACERLGKENGRCLICRTANPISLELHHPAQSRYDKQTIPLCRNHHVDASDRQKDHPGKIEGRTSPLEPIAHWLFGLGDLLRIAAEEPGAASLRELLAYVADKLHQLGQYLIELARSGMSETAGVP